MNGIKVKKRFYVIVIILIGLFVGGIYYTNQNKDNDITFIENVEDNNNSSKYTSGSISDTNDTKQPSNLENLDKDYDKVLVSEKEKEEKSQPKPSVSVEHKKVITKKDDTSSSTVSKDDEDKPAFYNISK
jgi:hypothetical protein